MKMNFSQLCTTLDGLLHASLLVESSFCAHTARLAQSVEHETLNLRVVGSSPTLGEMFWPSDVFRHASSHKKHPKCEMTGEKHPRNVTFTGVNVICTMWSV